MFADLLWFIDGCDDSLDTQRHILMILVATKQKADALVAGLAPVIQESLNQHRVLKLNVVHMTVFLTNIPSIHTYTHPFNGPLSGTTQVSRYEKGKSNLDFRQ